MSFKINDIEVKNGERLDYLYPVEDSTYKLPLRIICGYEDGPTTLVAAGLHGLETLGIKSVISISKNMKPEDIKGTIVFILNTHTTGSYQVKCSKHGIDGNDGKARCLHNIEVEKQENAVASILKKFDYFIDTHSGDGREFMISFAYYQGYARQEVLQRSLALAKVLNNYAYTKSNLKKGLLHKAAIYGVVGILIERGGTGIFQSEELIAYETDLKNVLKHIGHIDGRVVKTIQQIEIYDIKFVTANTRGLWYPSVKSGCRIEKGRELGLIRNHFGEILEVIQAEYDGIVVYMTMNYGLDDGDAIIGYGKFR